MIDACLDREHLDAYLAGKITAEAQGQIELHLRDCPQCQARAASRHPASDSMLRAIRRSAQQGLEGELPELAAALRAVCSPAATDTLPIAVGAATDSGRLIRDYELQRKLGEGGMGAVYLAMHTRLKRPVAIKLLKSDRNRDTSAIARFAVEMEAVGKLEHPHIVRALDAGEENGTHFLVMEYLAGIDLARLVRGVGPLALADACEVIRQAALGLHHAHENDVIHRDVKPSNLMVLQSGKVKVLDLGLARYRPPLAESQGLTGDHQVLGTLLYVAPEQLAQGGQVNARSDVFSLGVTLYELLLGRVPMKHAAASPSSNDRATRADVPPDVWLLAQRMTAHQRDQRPASMLDVAEVLRPWTTGANLPGLLQRFTGQSTLASVPTPQSGQLTPGGQWTSLPSVPLSGWTPIDVVPPPVSVIAAVPSAAPPADAPQPYTRGWFSSTALWLAATSLAVTAAVLTTIALTNVPRTDPPPPPALLAATAPVVLSCDEPAFAGLLDGLLKEGEVVAIHGQSGKRYALRHGTNDLPPGQYTLQAQSAECDLNPLQFTVTAPQPVAAVSAMAAKSKRAGDRRQELPATAPQQVVVLPTFHFKSVWKYPQLPANPGARAVYRGELWHAGLGLRDRATIIYRATLTILGDQEVDGVAGRWLEVDVYNDASGYRETACLLVDVKEWEDNQTLIVKRGWVTGESPALAARLLAIHGDKSPGVLVAPFQPDRDRLDDLTMQLGCGLPVDRVNAHQALVLLFGAECNAAPQWVRTLRARIPAPSKWQLGLESGSILIAPHLKVTAVDAAGLKLYLSRSQSIPFSFDRIQVVSPWLTAELKLDRQNPSDLAAQPMLPAEEELARLHQVVLSFPATASAFDVASLPERDGEGISYSGAVTMPSLRPLNYTADLRMVGSESIADVPHRWLQITVRSGADHVERAMLLIDENKYAERGELAFDHGWFICQDEVFPLDRRGDMKAIEAGLQLMGRPLPRLRLGVQDVAALVFGAPLKSAFAEVRPQFADHVTRSQSKLQTTFLQDYSLQKARVTLDAVQYELAAPAKEPASGETPSGPGYKIIRSEKAPFDFVDVDLRMQNNARLTALAERIWPAGEHEVESDADLAALAEHTRVRVAHEARARPNWRIWTLQDAEGRTALHWAEYGGRAGETILLRDSLGRIEPFPLPVLVDEEDRAAIELGRIWYGQSGDVLLRGELARWQGQDITMQSKKPDTASHVKLRLIRFRQDVDRELIRRLMSLTTEEPSSPSPPRRPTKRTSRK